MARPPVLNRPHCRDPAVTSYRKISAFYDAVMDDPQPRADRVTAWITRFHPHAHSLLELGCGTGAILARLPDLASMTGLDRSPEMLAVAREKVPWANLVEGDMASFSVGERFDVVICVFDSINHLLTFVEWRSMFGCVHDHLADDGLFIFDVNTLGELRRLGDEPPWVYDFDRGVMIMDVEFAADGPDSGMSRWDIRIFEEVDESRFELHHEVVDEMAVGLGRIRAAVDPWFVLLDEADERGGVPTDDSVKAHFALRRRS